MKKLNGYRPTHRNRWKLLAEDILSLQQLSLLEYYADIVDFDKSHEKYGLFEVNFEEISQIFKCSTSSVRGWHHIILLLGFVEKSSKKHWFKLVCHERFINPGKWGGQAKHYQEIEKDQPIEIILQSFGINLQTVREKLQQVKKTKGKYKVVTAKTDSIAIGSYKDEYKDSLVSPTLQSTTPRTMEDYKKIKEEEGFKYLTEEDMKWIDEHAYEDPAVPS